MKQGAFFRARGFVPQRDISALEAGCDLPAARARRERGSGLYRIAVLGIPGQPVPLQN